MAARLDGMTLVETVSLILLGALVAVVVVPAQQYVVHRQEQEVFATRCWENVQSLGNELTNYGKIHKGQYPKALTELKTKVPTCPAADPTKGNPYEAGYLYRNYGLTGGRFTVRCSGAWHGDVRVPKNQPQFDSLYGMQPTSLDFSKK